MPKNVHERPALHRDKTLRIHTTHATDSDVGLLWIAARPLARLSVHTARPRCLVWVAFEPNVTPFTPCGRPAVSHEPAPWRQ